MRFALSGWIATALLLPGAAAGFAQDPGLEPQIVRVSFVQGDVRLSRGRDAEKRTHAEWEQAAVDVPIGEGFSLVTGNGRAEIEFEDTSVAYVAENSVVVFNDLETVNGVPWTEVALLSGSMTISATPMVAGDSFAVRTPTDRFSVRYPERAFLRVNSYLDGTTFTSMRNAALRIDGTNTTRAVGGQTLAYSHGRRLAGDKLVDQTSYADFDQWANQRETVRNAAMADTMKQAGLNEPVPGLAQLQGQGHFYACPPYGTCWEPTNGFAGETTDAEKAAMAQSTVSVKTLAKGGPNSVPNAASPSNQQIVSVYDDFPCSPFSWRSVYRIDPLTGRKLLVDRQVVPMGSGLYGGNPYQWTVCHTGSWIRHQGRTVWVTGTKRHHHPPIHWVQTGRTVGFVPIHPKDVPGKLPENLKEGIVHPVDKHGSAVEILAVNSGGKVKELPEAPAKFEHQTYMPLSKAEAPRAVAQVLKPTSGDVRASGSPITFDHKSQSFMVAHQPGITSGATTTPRPEPIGGRGNNTLQPHSGGGGSAGAGFGGGASAMSHGGSGSSGSSGSSGGASHASAPAASPAPASAPAAASSAAPASSGGKH